MNLIAHLLKILLYKLFHPIQLLLIQIPSKRLTAISARFLNTNEKVPPDAIRIEEMLNYFNLNYTEPGNDSLFKQTS